MTIISKADIDQNISIMWDLVTQVEYEKLRNIAKQTLNIILKYYKLKGRECDEQFYYNIFHRLDYRIRKATPGNNKKKSLYKLLEEISKKLKKGFDNPIDELRQIYDDLKIYYIKTYSINKKEEKNNYITAIQDCFNNIEDLKTEMDKIGGIQYNYYAETLKAISECETMIPKLTLTTPSDGTMDKINNTFTKLFIAIQRVLAPPKMMNIEESNKDIQQMIQDGVSQEDIATGFGIPIDQLQDFLQRQQFEQEESVTIGE